MGLTVTKFFQLVETGGTLSDVSQCRGRMGGLRFGCQFPEDGVPRAVDSLRVGIVLMHNRLEGIE